MSQLTFYDLPSRGRCACWTLNPWKTRLALNYKAIDYKTEWIDYPDIAAKWKSLGVPPNAEGTPYTIPMVTFPDGQHVQDSWLIVHEMEKRYPAPEYPSLHLDYAKLSEIKDTTIDLVMKVVPCWMAKVPRNILDEKNAEYFHRTRQVRVGRPLDEMEKEHGNDAQWEKARPFAEKLSAILQESGGPYFMGETVSYADFIVAGMIYFLGKTEPSSIEKVTSLAPGLKTLYEACGKWFERDSY